MKTANSVGHEGVVGRVVNGVAFVSFRHTSGCSGCSVKSSCGMSEATDKVFRIPLRGTRVSEGDLVNINISMRSGYKAVLWGYVFPFVLVVAALATALSLGISEPASGLIALGILIPYFLLLKMFRSLFRNDLSIEVQQR